jgi:hypothetical protein
MEISAAQADVSEAPPALAKLFVVRQAGTIFYRQRDEYSVESPSFQKRGH